MLNFGKNFALCTTKKIYILTLVLSETKFLNETKNHNPPPPPPPFKLNGYMTKTLNHIIFFSLHQNQNIFFSNIGNQNIVLEKNHNPPPPPSPLQVKWSFPYRGNEWTLKKK